MPVTGIPPLLLSYPLPLTHEMLSGHSKWERGRWGPNQECCAAVCVCGVENPSRPLEGPAHSS